MTYLASVEKDAEGKPVLRVGQSTYRTVLVSNMLTIRPTTIAILKEFMAAGGRVIFAGELPAYVNAVESDEMVGLAKGGVEVPFEEGDIVNAIRAGEGEYVHITNAEGNTERAIFAQVRRDFGDEDAYAIALLNVNRWGGYKDLTVTVRVPEGYYVQEWDMENGVRMNAEAMATYADGCLSIKLDMEAAATRCFVLTRDAEDLPAVCKYETVDETVIKDEFNYSLDEKNVCILDWAKWRWVGKEWSGIDEVLRIDQQVRDCLGLERRGGEMLQPWYAKLNDTKQYGDIQLEYEFNIDVMPEGDVYLAGERPENNHYAINGVALHNDDINDFWVDDCFKKMLIPAGALKLGRNVVTIDVTFMRTTNIEALYLIGDFGVKKGVKICTLTDVPSIIGCHNYDEYNMPFYTGCMTYHMTPEQYAGKLNFAEGDRVVLKPESFTGGCVKVTAGGKTQVLGWDPYLADVTDAVRAGLPIDVTVVGTRRNVFGPMHQNPPLDGAYGPGNFVTGAHAWMDEYSLLPSGLTGIVLQIQKNIAE